MVHFKADHHHHSSTMCMMNKFREDTSFCDIKLIIGNQTIQAHRCILAAGSPYFNTLFLGQFTEAKMKEINLSEVTNNITALKNVIAFIYTGEIDIDAENLGVIIKLSSYFLIESLINFCCTFMTDNLSLASCLRYYLYAIDHGLFVVEKQAGPMVRSRFHDHLIYEEDTMEISADEMQFLVERNILQHCSNASILRFIALWVIKSLSERHILIAKEIFDDLIVRIKSPEICSLKFTHELSEDSLFEMIESSLSAKPMESKDLFLNSFKQVLSKLNTENEMHIVEMRSPLRNTGKETAIITLSPSNEVVEYNNKRLVNRTDPDWFINGEDEIITSSESIFYVCAYVPRTRCWYQLKKIYNAGSVGNFGALLDRCWSGQWMFDILHDDLLLVNFGADDIVVKDLKQLETRRWGDLLYSDFLDNELTQSPNDLSQDICLAAGKNNSRYLISKVRRFDNNEHDHLIGTYFAGYKRCENGHSWQKQFQTEVFDVIADTWGGIMNMYAKISSDSNEMLVVHSADGLNIVLVVDLNQDNASPVTVLNSPTDGHIDTDICKGTKIVESNGSMYIVTDGTTVTTNYNGKVSVRYEYRLNSQQLIKINSVVTNVGQIDDISNHLEDKEDIFPCLSEISASVGDGLWYMEGYNDIASFMTKVSVDSNKNPVVEHHTPPPFPSITAMFASKISSQILENKKPVTRFFGKE